MTVKNDSISGTDTASLLAVSSEFFSIANIITLPDEANSVQFIEEGLLLNLHTE